MKSKFKRLVVFDNIILTPEQKKRLINCAEKIEFFPKTENQNFIKDKIKDADAVINCWTVISKDSLKNSKVKYIGNWGHWWKHRIILSEKKLKEMKIHLDYIPDYGTDSVSELVWAGILALYKNLERWYKDAASGRWTYENIKGGKKKINIFEIQEHLIKNKILGIVGMGKIGSKVAETGLKGFDTKVIYYSKTRKEEIEKQGAKFVSLQELFKKSDIISIHVSPDASSNIISKELLNSMKPGAIFVNTSVGNILNQEALIEILKKGKIKAFLDVYEQFPPRKELRDLPNVLFTYRLGWFSQESIIKKGDKLISNIEKFLEEENDLHN